MITQRWLRLLVLALTHTLGASTAHAAIDASGPWLASIDLFSLTCTLDFDTSSGLRITGDCSPPIITDIDLSGTVSSSTGEFAATGTGGFLCTTLSIDGAVAADGRSFAGTLLCDTLSLNLNISGSRCGNGVVDSGEQCDDGGLADGDCCSSACLVEPEGGSCDDANSCTTGDHCEAGVCTASTQPDGASCNDGDACTQADVCTSGTCISGAPVTCDEVCQTCDPYQGCVYAPRYECSVYPSTGRLLLKDATDPSRDTLSIDLSGSTWLGVEDLGDPRSDTRYDVCVYDGDGLIGHGTVEPGGTCGRSTCWTPLPDGYRYRSYGTNALDSLVVRLKQNGKLTLKIRGKGEGLGIGPLPVTGDYPAIELRGSNGLCVGTGFPGWQRNGPTVAEARKRLFDW